MTSAANMLDVAARQGDFHRGFLPLREENSSWIDKVRGKLPADLRGTLFRNGPGSMAVGEQPYGHWFDGPGMVSAVTFADGKAHFKNRYVRTPKYLKDFGSGKISCRGFGTQVEGGLFKNLLRPISNPANTNVFWHGGKLCAFYEGGQPYRLDPVTLETEGPEYYGSALNARTTISAHGKVHPLTGHQINFGVNLTGFGLTGMKCALDVFDINPAGSVDKSTRIPLGGFPFLHDFGLTENYAVFLISSISFGLGGPLLGSSTLSSALSYDNSKAISGLVIDLRTMSVAQRFELPPGIVIHFGNSYESGDEIITDYFLTHDTDGFSWLDDVFTVQRVAGASLNRLRINLKSGTTSEESYDSAPIGEFPAWDTNRSTGATRYCFYAGHADNRPTGFFNSIVKLDTATGAARMVDVGENRYTSEALYVARDGATGEDDGYLLAFVYDAGTHRSEVVVLEAANPENELAAILLDHHVPFGFHGSFTRETFLA